VPYYVSADHPIFVGKDEPLIDESLAGLERVVPGFSRRSLVASRVFRDRWAQPICPTGFAAQVPPVATGIAGLYLVDSTQLYPADRSRSGMIGVVRQNVSTLFGPA
jgi:protoporphyrinogen oxidase